MNGGSRRQWILLVVLGLAVAAYFRYDTGLATSADTIGGLPAIDSSGVLKALQGVNTVKPDLVTPQTDGSDPDRNLFQYGEKRPPPPPPMTEEQRKAAEAALKKQEQDAREQKAKADADAAAAAEAQRLQQIEAAKQAAAQPPPEAQPQTPPPPPVKQAPPITYRFVGVLGPANKKFAVLQDGDKIVLARKGDVIDGKFKVLDIGPERVMMGYADPDLKGRQTKLDFGSQ